MNNKYLKFIVKVVICIVVLVSVFYLGGYTNTNNIKEQVKTTKLGFENMGELVTQTAYVTTVKDIRDVRKIFSFEIPFTESRKLFSYDTEVDASIDFSKISYIVKDKEILVKLPHAKVYKSTIKLDSFKSYFDKESIFSRIDSIENNKALEDLKKQAEEDAVSNGLLEAADNNAKTLIEGIIRSNEYKDYSVKYEYIG